MTVLFFFFPVQGKMFLFCGKTCSDEYKKKNKVMAMCDYCKLQKIIKETVRFSGVDKPFCSEGKENKQFSFIHRACCYKVIHTEWGHSSVINFQVILFYEV